MSVPAAELLTWAAGRGGHCLAAVGVLGVRPLRYLVDGVAPGPQPLAGLSVRVRGEAERPLWHPSTGLYGFLRLPPGPVTIEITDPARRFLPQVVTATLPDRLPVRRALEQCRRPPAGSAAPLLLDVAMHAAPELVLPPGATALWGVVSQLADGAPLAGALIQLESVYAGLPHQVTTLSAADGSYLLPLPGEVVDRRVAPPGREFSRALRLFSPRPPLAAALADDFVGGLPAEVYALDPTAANSPFRPRRFRLRAADGGLRRRVGGRNPDTTVSIGESVRWDVELLA